MARRSWFVMTPNEAKSNENVLTCLQADLTPVGMCVRAGEIGKACIRTIAERPSQRERDVAVHCAEM